MNDAQTSKYLRASKSKNIAGKRQWSNDDWYRPSFANQKPSTPFIMRA